MAANENNPQRRKEDKLKNIWAQDKAKRKGASKKIRLGLRRKLFLMIVTLIAGLLFAVYTITLNDERKVLKRELEIRGGTIVKNLSDSIYNTYANLKSARFSDTMAIDPDTPAENVPIQFVDSVTKAKTQQDFVSCYAINKKNRAFVHSDKKGYLFKLSLPKGIFGFKAIYPVKLYLEKLLERKKQPINDLKSYENVKKYLENIIGFKDKIKLLETPDSTVSFIKKDKTIFLSVKFGNKEELFNLNMKHSEIEPLIKLVTRIIINEYSENTMFVENAVTDLRKLRRTTSVETDRKIIETAYDKITGIIDKDYIYVSELTDFIKKSSNLINGITNPLLKVQVKKIITGIKNFVTMFNPIVQIKRDKISEENSEDLLYISYPMCETDKYFKTYRGEVHLLLSQKGILYTINNAEEKLQLAAIVAILVGTIFALILALFIVQPIKRLVESMRKVRDGDLNQTVIVKSSDEIGLLADNFNEMTSGLREKEKIRAAMNKAVSKDIAEEMLSGELKLGGEIKDVTVLFSDIRSFTTISESLSPENLLLMLNEYMTIMTNIVEKHWGTVDKFVGDEIMAQWGAPKSHGNDTLSAAKAALDMMDELHKLNNKRASNNEEPIDIGIGLNSGPVTAGMMGSENRMNYTLIGDHVNLGARLEGTNKIYGTHIIISENTFREIKDLVYVRELDLIRVKGKNEPVGIYELMGLTETGEAIRTERI